MKIVVLAGGRSTERNVSLSSSARVANALREKGHQVAVADLFLGLPGLSETELAHLFTDQRQTVDLNISDEILTDDAINAMRPGEGTQLFGPNVLKIAGMADIVYVGLHGEDGENGKVQAVLDLNNIAYTGSDTLGSGVAMDKSISKQIMMFNGIQTARFVAVREGDDRDVDLPFDFPVVVKPSNGGSSVGTYIVRQEDQLRPAIDDALQFDDEILIEEFIKGREFSLGVVNGVAMPAIEITVNDGWYDFEHKFQSDSTTVFQTPPDIPADVHAEMQAIAKRTMKVLKMSNYGRVDFFWNDDGLFVIEANSLPGMTPLSLLPQEAEAAGISYPDLCDSIVQGKVDLLKRQALRRASV
ncbi:D-alanine--D-alanine ligase [uncultured Secundilactobacillus sp.]|uniref:D-alanine--D-alanine ligase family protein n=1 Tax=uncultured Secundilactobacillus sp. TaxID=2813935 RepID=UPI00258C99FB|nr:D-alanine--D-alanine ligase [uncultured Secundilactobacillus sp.]